MRALYLLPLALIACDPDPKETGQADDTGAGADDTGGGDDSGAGLEEGCILVDGGGGYAKLTDALSVASEGAVIEVCEGYFLEAVVVDKAVTIRGAGVDLTTLAGPTNDPPLTITASDVTIEGLALESTRSGVVVDAAVGTVLQDIAALAVDNYGVEANAASGLQITGATFGGAAYGGVQVDSGDASVADSTFSDNVAFAIHGTSGASLSISGVTIEDTTATDLDSIADGHAIWLEDGSEATISSSTLTNNLFIGVYGVDSTLSLDGVSITGSLYGIIQEGGGDFSANALTLTDNLYYGLAGLTSGAATLTSSVISGDRDVVVNVDTADWRSDGVGYLGAGAWLASPSITVSDLAVTGYNNAGLVLTPYDSDGAATLERVQLSDNGRIGLFAGGLDVLATDVDVSGVIEVEDAGEEQCYTVDRNAGVVLSDAYMTWVGGSVLNNDGYGISSVVSVLDLSGAEIGGNTCAGVMNFEGSAVIDSATFTQPGGGSFEGSVVGYEASSTSVSNSLFTDSSTFELSSSSEYTDSAGTVYRWDYYYYLGSDLQFWRGGENEVYNNTFINGATSVYAYDADVSVEDNTWSNYQGELFYIYGDSGATLEIKDAVVDGFSSYVGFCYNANLDIDGLVATNGGLYTYNYESYVDGALSYSVTSTYANPVFYGYGCTATVQDTELTNTDGHILRTYGGTYEFDGLVADSVGLSDTAGYTFYMYLYSTDLETRLRLEDSSITNIGTGGGIGYYLYADASVALETENLELSGASGDAIYVYNSDATYTGVQMTLADTALSDVSRGLEVTGGDLTIDGLTIAETDAEGVKLSSATLDATGLTITDAGTDGAAISSSELLLTDSSITGSGSDGLTLTSTSGTVLGNTITGNSAYGMVCSSATSTRAETI